MFADLMQGERNVLKKLLLVSALWAVLSLTPLASAQTDTSSCPIADYAAFLSDRYGVQLSGDVDQTQFADAAAGIAGVVEIPTDVDLDGFTQLEALLTSLYYVNLDELALTFPEDKADKALADVTGLPADLPLAQRQALAAAFDAGLIDAGCISAADLSGPVSAEFAGTLLGQIANLTGNYEHWLGSTGDADIYNRLVYAYGSFDQVLEPELQAPANDLIRKEVITGYNLKRTSQDAGFDPDLSIVYGHANLDHARQLIGLLRSEDIDARLALEPKTSAYLYLAEWGEPTVSPEFQVEPLDDGNYIAYAKEFDLAFAFNDEADRDRFDAIIKAYAKKDEKDEPGLILGSWWQPLYSSRTALKDYVQVVNNVVYLNQFYLQSFSLPDKSEAIIDGFKTAYPDGKVEVWDLWVNEAFHNYLLGLPT